jgi:hypothetical protein
MGVHPLTVLAAAYEIKNDAGGIDALLTRVRTELEGVITAAKHPCPRKIRIRIR